MTANIFRIKFICGLFATMLLMKPDISAQGNRQEACMTICGASDPGDQLISYRQSINPNRNPFRIFSNKLERMAIRNWKDQCTENGVHKYYRNCWVDLKDISNWNKFQSASFDYNGEPVKVVRYGVANVGIIFPTTNEIRPLGYSEAYTDDMGLVEVLYIEKGNLEWSGSLWHGLERTGIAVPAEIGRRNPKGDFRYICNTLPYTQFEGLDSIGITTNRKEYPNFEQCLLKGRGSDTIIKLGDHHYEVASVKSGSGKWTDSCPRIQSALKPYVCRGYNG